MSARQLIVLGVALVAALGALLLIRSVGARAAPTAHAEVVVGRNVLVAARNIPQGAALTTGDIKFVRFPEASISDQFIVGAEGASVAESDYAGSVTRRTFVAGEPIIQSAIIKPDGRGFLAAQVPPGYRAVAVEIKDNTAAGGFIQPNDHVDVMVTLRVPVEGQNGHDEVRSDVVLEDVRVLALDDHVQPQTAGQEPERIEAKVAVLELSASDARIIEMADALGEISLVLRGVQSDRGVHPPSKLRHGTSVLDQYVQRNTVRVHAFGTVSGGGQ
jgi:pilus assembly protein CpaB